MDYLRKVDFAALDADPDQKHFQWLLNRDSGAENCAVLLMKTPPGQGSAEGLHTHPFEQLFYLLSGTMNLEIEGKEYVAEPGTLIIFPAGVPHRNWNGGSVPTMHLSLLTPAPGGDKPAATRVTSG